MQNYDNIMEPKAQIYMNRDFSIIDSNIVRAKEGLRVMEDICRFGLQKRDIFEELKIIRHGLDDIEMRLSPAHLLFSRTEKEIGQAQVVAEEYSRQSVWSLIRANSRRTSESLRVLEELSKIYDKQIAYKIEDYRYKIYELELKMLLQTPHFWLNKYFEEGVIYPLTESVDEAVWLIEHGVKIFQLRDKSGNKREIYQKAKYLCEYLKKFEVKIKNSRKILFIMNDYLDIASVLPVAGVHFGQDDGTILEVRKKLGSLKIVGRSNHSFEQIKKSKIEGWDYLSVGPVYTTPTKEGRPAVGLELVKQVAENIFEPWLAIGGIDKDTINEVKQAGAKNFAVVRSAKEFFN